MFQDNERYEGFCIEILKALSDMYEFNYTIYQVADNKYGLPNEKGEWNGLVKELIDGVSFTNRKIYFVFKKII